MTKKPLTGAASKISFYANAGDASGPKAASKPKANRPKEARKKVLSFACFGL